MKSSNNTSLNSSGESLRRNDQMGTNPLAPKVFHSNVTLEMIDEFFNPLSRKKDQSKLSLFKTANQFGPATNGLGIIDESSSDPQQNQFFCQREMDNNNNNYADKIKTQFERELIESYASQANLSASTVFKSKEDHSIVGSGMSQIESVSSMNMSMNMRARIMNQARNLTRIVDEEESIDLNNNNSKIISEIDAAQAARQLDDEQKRLQDIIELSKTYKRREHEPDLPISARRQEIVKFINSSQFTIIRGGTGCGKTTQVPQFILDDHVDRKKYCNIIVTQPRRIAATSVARRVCSERSWQLGDICGYQIGLERNMNSETTRILYVTTGVLLQKLIGPQADENFNKYTHIIIDEVHERDLDTDFVLLVIKLKSYRNLNCKIILMSATIDCELFSKYYVHEENQLLYGRRIEERVPIFNIDSRTFKVQEYYWDDLVSNQSFLSYTIQKNYQDKLNKKENLYQKSHDDSLYQRNYKSYAYSKEEQFSTVKQYKQHIQSLNFRYEDPEMSQEAMNMCMNLLHYFDDEDLKMCENQAEKEVDNLSITLSSLHTTDEVPRKNARIIDGLPEVRGSVLIFVPGMHNIQQLNDLINREFSPDYFIDVMPLHSEIPLAQQQRVFTKSKPCHRKVIISTSIAESSITVPDIKYVIDFCLTKELYSDPQTNYTHLRQEWASRSSLNQRRGRAGRVSDGTCYRLITRELFNQLESYTKSAVLREPLSRIILNVKRLNIVGEPKKILSMAIEPPRLSDIQRTVLVLKEVGALTLCVRSSLGEIENNPNDGDLTYAGKIMANLPIDERLSKLILLGHVFGKLKEAITIAAGLSTKTIFTSFYKSYLEAYKSKWMWAAGWMCDCLAILTAVNTYENNEPHLITHKERVQWAKANNIELERLKDLLQLRFEIEERLLQQGIKTSIHMNPNPSARRPQLNTSFKPYDLDDEDQLVNHYLIIKLMIAGAFYPNYLNSSQVNLNEAYRLVGYHDIKTTVQVKNFPNNEGILYDEKLTDLFRPCSNAIQNHFEDTKAYVEFKDEYEGIKSNINFSVYLAVEMRLLRIPMRLRRYNQSTANERLKQLRQAKNSSILNITIDKNQSGIMKFDVGSVLGLNKLNSTLQTNESDETHTIIDENSDTDSIADFIVSKEPVKDLDQSKFLSCASVMNCINSSIKKAESVRNLETSSRLSGSRVGRSSIAGSQSNVSSIRRSTVSNQLATNRVSSTCNTDYSIVDHLKNPKFLLPEKVDDGELIDIVVTEIVECGHFWVQISDEAHKRFLTDIQVILNKRSESDMNLSASMSSIHTASSYHLKLLNPNKIVLNALCVTHFSADKQLYRAQIININKTEQKATVLFIDYGNKEKKSFKELFEMSLELFDYPFQALECRLGNIKMSILKNPNSMWTKSANDLFVKKIEKHHGFRTNSLKIKVLDLADTVALVKLVSKVTENDIGDEIIAAGYAERVDSIITSMQKFTSTENVLYMPTRQSDYTARRAHVAGGHEIGHFNVRSTLNYLPINRSLNESWRLNDTDNFDDYDHDDMSSISGSTFTFNDDESSFMGMLELNGPYSPLEVHYYPLVNVGKSKKTRVSRGSINHVTLDDDPFNDTPRLMISTEIFLNATADSMVMRNTTLMPKLRGLTTICCLLFSPVVEFRLDDKKTCLTGALCGLGADSNGAIYTDNDIEMTFDVSIDMNDIHLVNQVRLAINNVIGNEELARQWTNDDTNLKNLQRRNCQILLDVIQRTRKSVDPKYPLRPHSWNQISPVDLKEWNWKEANKPNMLGLDVFNEYYGYHCLVNLNKTN